MDRGRRAGEQCLAYDVRDETIEVGLEGRVVWEKAGPVRGATSGCKNSQNWMHSPPGGWGGGGVGSGRGPETI